MDEVKKVKTMYYVDRKNVSARYMSVGWFEGNFELPESKRTTVRISDNPTKNVFVSSVFKDCEKGRIKVLPNDYNNQFTITVNNGNAEESFVFGISIMDTKQLKPKLALDDKERIYALYCFIEDAISGSMTFEDFKGEYGYEDCCEAHKIWKACQDATLKAVRLNIGDLYEISNFIQEKYPDVV